ncbi:MAG: aminotransferase class I/II-fold pyridoxal phosphate-dependent enzyme [Butyricicoccaceae bacterium]
MQYEISNRMSDVHGSAIRELFKLGADPNMISFGGGNPSAETFPVPEIADIIADVMKNAPVSVLQYGLSEGYMPLRETMKDYLTRTQGFDFEENELFILSGGQQCADLTTKVLVNEGDVILTETLPLSAA